MSAISWLLDNIASFGDRTAITYRGTHISFSDLLSRVENWDSYLNERDVRPGEVVAVQSGFSDESIALLLALARRENIIVPISTETQSEIEWRIKESNSDYVIWLGDGSTAFEHVAGSEAEHPLIENLTEKGKPGLILFSSGSTGPPKAMVHDLDRLVSSYQGKGAKNLRILVFLMFDHIGGINTLFNALATGLTMVLPENRDASHVASLIEKHKVNILPASPTFLNLLLMSDAHREYELSSLRLITYGTEPMPDSLLKRLREEFPRAKFVQTFGTSETGINKTESRNSDSTYMKLKGENIEHKIVDGELWLRSDTQIEGYLNQEEDQFTEEGWFKTGDIVEKDDDGYIKIVGRSKEMINVGGEKVVPSEVESVIMEMENVEDCLVYGESNAITGEVVSVDVVWKGSHKPKEIRRKVRNYCSERIDRYKMPAEINPVDQVAFTERFKKIRREQN